jgi:N-acetylmuramoyl-L-alanine amidase
MKILIDPGHSAQTPGKRSPDGTLREYKWAREVAALLEKRLDELNISHERTTTSDEDNTEISLNTRCKRANAIAKKEKCILVSIHCNAAGADGNWHNAKGWSVFVSLNASGNSKKLASFMTSAAKASGVKVRVPSPGVDYWTQNLAICRDTSMPAVLVENMFQDNKEDVAYLLSDEGKNTLTEIMVKGICDYIKTV